MHRDDEELQQRLQQIERVNIPWLVGKFDPSRADPCWRRTTLGNIYDHLDAVDAAEGDPTRLADLAAEREDELARIDASLEASHPHEALHGFLTNDRRLWEDVGYLISIGHTGHARGSYLREEEQQIGNAERSAERKERKIEALFDEASKIRAELRRRGQRP